MIRRTFLTLLGAVAWPWRKVEANNGITWSEPFTIPRRYMSHGTYKSKIPTDPCVYHGPAHFVVRNVSGHRIESGTLVKFVLESNGVIPCDAATS